jgi:hypothetical protein
VLSKFAAEVHLKGVRAFASTCATNHRQVVRVVGSDEWTLGEDRSLGNPLRTPFITHRAISIREARTTRSSSHTPNRLPTRHCAVTAFASFVVLRHLCTWLYMRSQGLRKEMPVIEDGGCIKTARPTSDSPTYWGVYRKLVICRTRPTILWEAIMTSKC